VRRGGKIAFYVCLALVLICALPIALALTAGTIAEAHGCRLDEAGVYPCVIDGRDYGTTLAAMGMVGWLMLLTVPIGAVALAGGVVAAILWAVGARRARRAR